MAFHAVVLLLLGWSVAPRLGPPPRPPPPDMIVSLGLEPPIAGRVDLPRPRSRISASPLTAATSAPPAPVARMPSRPPTPSATPLRAGRPAERAPPSAPAAHPAPLPGAEPADGVRGVLRATVGCEHRDAVGLTAAERERCNQTAGEIARAAPSFGPLPSEKLPGFVAASAAAERRRASREGALPNPVQACQGQGSNLGLGCLPPEASHHIAIP